MSKMKWMSALAASLGILLAACWLVTATFPLAAAPQVVNDAPGVTVDLGGTALIHRAPVPYSDKRIQGNLAAADGCLVAAGKTKMTVYLPEE